MTPHTAALLELAYAKLPTDVREPLAVAALHRVAEMLQHRLPAGRWPFPYQFVALAFGELTGDRCLFADDMGLGKTAEALCRVAIADAWPVVIVTPASALSVWEREIPLWLPRVPLVVLPNQQTPVPPAGFRGIVLTTWSLLRFFEPLLWPLRPAFLVIDEAHYAKNEETWRSQALAQLARRIPRLLLLTGTPIENTAVELWQLLRLLDPRAWPSEAPFQALDEAVPVSERKHTLEAAIFRNDPLQRKIRQFMCRRLMLEVQPLAPKQYREILVEMPREIQAEYKAIEDRFTSWFYRAAAVGAAQGKHEFHTSKAMRAEYLQRTQALRRFVGLLKVGPALNWVRTMRRQREPVILFGEHKDVLNALAAGLMREGMTYVRIDGTTPKEQRKEAMRAFMQQEVDILLASRAAREGVTLTRAAHVCFVERWWTPTGEDQGEARAWRVSQRRQVTIWKIHVADTIDVRMRDILQRKRGIVEKVVGARG